MSSVVPLPAARLKHIYAACTLKVLDERNGGLGSVSRGPLTLQQYLTVHHQISPDPRPSLFSPTSSLNTSSASPRVLPTRPHMDTTVIVSKVKAFLPKPTIEPTKIACDFLERTYASPPRTAPTPFSRFRPAPSHTQVGRCRRGFYWQ